MSGTDDDDFAARVGAGAPQGGAGGWDDDDEAPEFSDEDLALRFASLHVYNIRHVAKWGKWFLWTGKVWAADEKMVAFSLSRQICRAAARECAKREAKGVASMKKIAAVEKLARADPRLATTTGIWDADPWLLNTPDGVVDLRTGQTRPHSSGDYMTKITAVGPGGDCPLFKTFLNDIMAGDQEMIAFIQRVLGYCLTGDVSEEVLFFLHGTGQNGKTVLTSTLEWILADYCVAAGDEVFMETHNERHSTELARLSGARVVLVSEVTQGSRWNETRLKKVTGGDTVTARFMRQDDFQFKPKFKPLIQANHKPQLKTVDVAMRRRLVLLPFLVTIPEEKRDNELKEKLKGEGGGILRLMIEGCLEYLRIGLAPPQSVVEATNAYFLAEDAVQEWISEWCETGLGISMGSQAMFNSWRLYAEKNRLAAGNNKKFKDEMARLGFIQRRTSGGMEFIGIKVRSDAPREEVRNRYEPDPDRMQPF